MKKFEVGNYFKNRCFSYVKKYIAKDIFIFITDSK